MREKLIELLCKAMQTDDCVGHCNSNCGRVETAADHLIANGVTVQKRGNWEKYGYKWKCNNCLEKINIDGTPEENGLYYCPNCGADMRGEEHE